MRVVTSASSNFHARKLRNLSINIDILGMAIPSSANAPQFLACDPSSPTTAARRGAMAVLSQALAEEIEAGLRAVVDPLSYVGVRAPGTGLVMLRGGIGGGGGSLNLGGAAGTPARVPNTSGGGGIAHT